MSNQNTGAKPDQDQDRDGPNGRPEVEFLDLNTNEVIKFHVEWNDTLDSAWATAYKKLKEERSPEDKLLCDKDGASLMEYLALTFAQLRDRKICQARKYRMRRRTGGA